MTVSFVNFHKNHTAQGIGKTFCNSPFVLFDDKNKCKKDYFGTVFLPFKLLFQQFL